MYNSKLKKYGDVVTPHPPPPSCTHVPRSLCALHHPSVSLSPPADIALPPGVTLPADNEEDEPTKQDEDAEDNWDDLDPLQ